MQCGRHKLAASAFLAHMGRRRAHVAQEGGGWFRFSAGQDVEVAMIREMSKRGTSRSQQIKKSKREGDASAALTGLEEVGAGPLPQD